MLTLRLLKDESGNSGDDLVPLGEQTVRCLERALLSLDEESCARELQFALANDPAFARWAIQAAADHIGRAVSSSEEAAAALLDSLASKLAVVLTHCDPQ